MTDDPEDDNVVTLPFVRGELERAPAPVDDNDCRHYGASRMVSDKDRIVRCGQCAANLDPMDCLIEIVEDVDRVRTAKKRAREELAELGEKISAAKRAGAAVRRELREEKRSGAVVQEQLRIFDAIEFAVGQFFERTRTETPSEFATAAGMISGMQVVLRGLYIGQDHPELEGLLRRLDAATQELDARRRRKNIRLLRGLHKEIRR